MLYIDDTATHSCDDQIWQLVSSDWRHIDTQTRYLWQYHTLPNLVRLYNLDPAVVLSGYQELSEKDFLHFWTALLCCCWWICDNDTDRSVGLWFQTHTAFVKRNSSYTSKLTTSNFTQNHLNMYFSLFFHMSSHLFLLFLSPATVPDTPPSLIPFLPPLLLLVFLHLLSILLWMLCHISCFATTLVAWQGGIFDWGILSLFTASFASISLSVVVMGAYTSVSEEAEYHNL